MSTIPTPPPPVRPVRPGRRRRGVLLRHEAGALLRIAAPIVLSQLGGIGMNTIDDAQLTATAKN